LKGDVVDFLDAGGSLATVVAAHTGVLASEPVQTLLAQTIVTTGFMVYPGSRNLHSINEENGKAVWLKAYGSLPSTKQLQEYLGWLRNKADESPTTISPRVYTNEQQTWWKPNQGPAYRISAEGVVEDDDP